MTSRVEETWAHPPGTAPRPPGAPPPWEAQFLEIVHNEAKTAGPSKGPVRKQGFLVLTRGTRSLQHVQGLCARLDPRGITCLTARYEVRRPVVGSLIAAFVADLALLVRSPGTDALRGDLWPDPASLTGGPWDNLIGEPFAELAEQARLQEQKGELPDGWTTHFLDVLRSSGQLPTGVRLILFAEVTGRMTARDTRDLEAFAGHLPERVGIVVSGGGRGHGPHEIGWNRNAKGPTGWRLELGVGPRTPEQPRRGAETLLSGDSPAEVDALGRRRYARGLAQLVLLPGTGAMTIGIHAPWGRGKTSFMRFVQWELLLAAASARGARRLRRKFAEAERALADPGVSVAQRDKTKNRRDRLLTRLRRRARRTVVPVWFNAWLFDGATQIWAGLTYEITRQLERALPWRRRFSARLAYAIRAQGPTFWIGAVLPVLAATLVTALLVAFGLYLRHFDVVEQLPDWAGWLLTVAPSVTVIAVGCYAVWRFTRALAPVSERLLDYVRQPDYRMHMGYQNQVRDDIRFLKNRLGRRKRRPRVVVFIDDLDRCSDGKVLETLQAINLLLTASECYVFLGIDTTMVTAAVAREYKLDASDTERAQRYLQKIIQLSFRLPEPTPDQQRALVTQLFGDPVPGAHAGGRPSTDEPGTAPTLGAESTGRFRWSTRDVRRPTVELGEYGDTGEERDSFDRLRDIVDGPRETKRLANLLRMVKTLVQRPGVPSPVAIQRLLVAWLVLCLDHRDVATQLVRNARSSNPAAEVHEHTFDPLLQRINADPDHHPVVTLTYGQLGPGTALAEAAAICLLFDESPPTTAPAETTA